MSDKNKIILQARIDKISFELSRQARLKPDDAKVEEYAASLEAGEELPPVDLYREDLSGGDYVFCIGNGWTRIRAHQLLGREIIAAYIHEGGREAALKHACRANTSKEHGVVRTQADARNAVKLYLKEGDWHKHSDREVGRACEVDHKTVATIRHQLEESGEIPKAQQRLGLDGVTRELPKEKELGNSPVEEKQPSLLIDTTVQSSQKVTAAFDEAEAKQAPKREPAPRCNDPECPRLSTTETGYCEEHDPTIRSLHKLIVDLEHKSFERDWQNEILIVGRKQSATVIQALSILQDSKVRAKVEYEGEDHYRVCFTDAVFGKTLCWFVSTPPKPEKKEVAEDSATSKNGSGERYQHYNTPEELAVPLAKVGDTGLDPCYNDGCILNPRVKLDEKKDGLSDKWNWADLAKGDLVIINPPYNNITPWVDRVILEAARGANEVLIVPNRSDADWHHKASESCKLMAVVKGRVNFLKEGVADKSPQESTILFYWGSSPGRFGAVAKSEGWRVLQDLTIDAFAGAASQLREDELNAKQRVLPVLAKPSKEEVKRCIIGDCKKPREFDLFYCAGHRFFDEHFHGQDQTKCSVKDCPRIAWMCGDCVEHYVLPTMAEMLIKKQRGETLYPACGCYCPDCKDEEGEEEFISETEMEEHKCFGWLVWFTKAQSLLPSPKAKEESHEEKRLKFCETTPCGDCGSLTLEASKFFGRNEDDKEICRACAAKRDAEPLTLHKAIKACAKRYQQDGYEVKVVGARGTMKFSVLGYLNVSTDPNCFQGATRKDENSDFYSIEFLTSQGGLLLCTLHATKKEKSKPDEEFPSVWLVRGIKAIQDTTTQEECVKVSLPLIERASNDAELHALQDAFESTKAKLPHAENVRSPRASEAKRTTLDRTLTDYLRIISKQQTERDVYQVRRDGLKDYPDNEKEIQEAADKRIKALTAPKKAPPKKAPTPKRNKGKDETPLKNKKKPQKKAGKR